MEIAEKQTGINKENIVIEYEGIKYPNDNSLETDALKLMPTSTIHVRNPHQTINRKHTITI